MSRQVQIRRGTSTEHNAFTGAPGEITFDTCNKTLRVHDGETAGGNVMARQSSLDAADYVIASQLPTAENGYTWYRKYKSGWVEQGGRDTMPTTELAVIFPIAMSNTKYTYQASGFRGEYAVGVQRLTTTGFTLDYPNTVTGDISWSIYGIAA